MKIGIHLFVLLYKQYFLINLMQKLGNRKLRGTFHFQLLPCSLLLQASALLRVGVIMATQRWRPSSRDSRWLCIQARLRWVSTLTNVTVTSTGVLQPTLAAFTQQTTTHQQTKTGFAVSLTPAPISVLLLQMHATYNTLSMSNRGSLHAIID